MEPAVRTDIKPVRMTRHANQRMSEQGMTYNRAVYMLLHSVDEHPVHMGRYKAMRYHGNEGVRYLRYGTYIFTVKDKPDRKTGMDITLVITVTDQRLTLKMDKVPPDLKGKLWMVM